MTVVDNVYNVREATLAKMPALYCYNEVVVEAI